MEIYKLLLLMLMYECLMSYSMLILVNKLYEMTFTALSSDRRGSGGGGGSLLTIGTSDVITTCVCNYYKANYYK